MAKRLLTRVKEKLSELDLPYFQKDLVVEVEKYEDWRTFQLDFVLPFNSMQILVRFCEENNCSIAFDKNNSRIDFTIHKPNRFAILGLGEQE